MVSQYCLQALQKAAENAELQRLTDMARFQTELNQRKALEDDLKRKARQHLPKTVPDSDLAKEVDQLRRKSTKQTEDITRWVAWRISYSCYVYCDYSIRISN